MRTYVNLSDHDFELLVADLLRAKTGHKYEAFARGADLGIDLRFADKGTTNVVQCKHMAGSSIAQIVAAARAEATKLRQLKVQPTSYLFVTTKSLTAANKTAIASELAEWITNDNQVLGADDLEGLLNSHPDVERAHVKLWLSSGGQLEGALASQIWARSQQMFAEVNQSLPRYVETGVYAKARKQLRDRRVLVLSGSPGIGKTTLARMLIADAASDGYEPVEISTDIEEANQIVNDRDRRVFYYDDFLGSTFLQDRLVKNEDKRLAAFVRRCTSSSNNLLVLTTREHILKQASTWYEELDRSGIPLLKLLLELKSYSRYERAEILHNHLASSPDVDSVVIEDLLLKNRYLEIIDHPNYNPRLIEYITGLSSARLSEVDRHNFVSFALEVFSDPSLIWQAAFEKQLDADCKDVVVCLASMPAAVPFPILETAFEAAASLRGRTLSHGAFRATLRVLDDSFTTSKHDFHATTIGLANPSIADFAASWLSTSPAEALRTIESTTFFDQLDWVDEKLVGDADEADPSPLVAALGDAIVRCFDSPTTKSYGKAHPSERLTFAYETMQKYAALAKSLSNWFEHRVGEEIDRWKEQHAKFEAAVTFALTLRANEKSGLESLVHRELESALVSKVSGYWALTSDWEELDRFQRESNEQFSGHELGLSAVFRTWAIGRLDNEIDEFEGHSDLNELADLAAEYGVNIEDDPSYDAAYEAISEREPSPSLPKVAERKAPIAREMSESEQSTRIGLLFENLAAAAQAPK